MIFILILNCLVMALDLTLMFLLVHLACSIWSWSWLHKLDNLSRPLPAKMPGRPGVYPATFFHSVTSATRPRFCSFDTIDVSENHFRQFDVCRQVI